MEEDKFNKSRSRPIALMVGIILISIPIYKMISVLLGSLEAALIIGIASMIYSLRVLAYEILTKGRQCRKYIL